MSVVADTEQAVAILERLQERVAQTGNKSQEDDIAAMVCMLDSNLFKQLLNIQVSMKELKEEVDSKRCQDPSEFHLGPQGDLVLSPTVEERRSYPRKRTQEQREAELNKYALANDAFEWDDTEEQSSGYLDKEPQTTEAIVENGSDLAKYGPAFQQDIAMAAQGREVQVIQLYKPEGGGLGFSVVGLKSENRGELGIFVQDIQPTGVAAKDGRVQESDQILAIDGQLLDSSISHHLAIGILQRAQGLVEMVVARGGIPSVTPVLHGSPSLDRTPSAVSSVSQQSGRASASPEPPTIKWEHVENVTLHNDGTGLGFGIVGGRSTGVVVKTILPRGVADRDGRLKSGDHILKISDTSLAGMNSEQVANVLRQSGTTVTLTIARNPTYETQPVIPQHSIPVTHAAAPQPEPETEPEQQDAQLQPVDLEEEIFEVQLVKDSMGLGITIAGYLAQGASEEMSGIYVKSVAEGSTADRDGRIHVGDKIIEVDGMSLQGFSNKEAVDVLRQTGTTVKMKLARSRVEAIEQESPPPPPQYEMPGPPSAYLLAGGDADYGDSQVMPPAYPPPDRMAAYPDGLQEPPQQQPQQHIPVDVIPAAYMKDDYIGELSPEAEEGIIAYWKSILGPDTQVVVAQISKFREGGGLGISLEGTVDIENGEEVRPHHYVRSILPDGPVGQNGKLESGDELLEVNGTQLLGLNHVDVISILKELPMHVRIVVARHPHPVFPDPGESEARASPLPMAPQLTISEPNLAAPVVAGEGMMKAHSELALPVTDVKPAKSLDPGAGLAMWSDEPTEIILNKGDQGLGFSILDYQDPVNPEETVIVIRSLVPGGVADQDGRLIPGDRLVRVNDIELENCSLERAVQALKGAPKGPVRIGVTKPLPISESAEMEQIPSPLKEQHTQQAPPSQDDEHESTDEEDQQEVSLGNQGAFTVIDIQEQDVIKSETQPVESASAAAADEEQRRIEAIRRDAFSAMNQYAVATGQQPQEPPAPAPAPEPQPSEAPLFRAPPPLNYSSSEELDDEDEEQKKPSDDEKESLEAKRREALMAMNMYATATGKPAEVKVQEPVRQPPPEPVREPSPEPPRQPSPPPRIDADELREREEQQKRLEAVRREAAMAMSAYAVATGKPAEVIRQPTPEPEVQVAPPRGEEEVSIEAMRVDTQAAMSAFAVVAGQDEPEDMAIVSATPIMIEDSDDNDEFDAPPPLPEGPPPPLPFGPPPSFADLDQRTTDEAFQEPISMVPAATVALATLERQEDMMSSPAESPIGSPSNMDRKAMLILPDYMEKTIRLKKGNAGLGLLTSAEKGNGVIVRTITRGGIVDQDGRIRVGDYITGVNRESMRDLTNSQARSLLRRCALIGTDIRITYIPGAEAAKYLENPESYTPPHEAEVEESPTPEPAEEIPAPQEFTAVFAEPSVAAVAVEQSEAAPVPGDYDVQETVGDTLQEPIDMAAAVNTARTPPPVPRKPQTRALYSDGSPGVVATARWEPVRTVQLTRVPNKSLGISIVGGRTGEGPIAQGIFIKHVLEDSPAGRNGTLKTGDRILEVNGHDLRTATHDQAVEVIRNATSPVTFLIQSLAPSACVS